MRDLLDHQKDRIGAGTDQRARVDQAIGHHAVEGRRDFRVSLHSLQRTDRCLRGPACLLAGVQERLGGLHLFFRLDQLVAGDRSGCFGGLLHAIVCALRRCKLSLGLQAVSLGRLHFRLSFGDLRGHLRSAQFGEQVCPA